jgi:hypothetical protein
MRHLSKKERDEEEKDILWKEEERDICQRKKERKKKTFVALFCQE